MVSLHPRGVGNCLQHLKNSMHSLKTGDVQKNLPFLLGLA